MPAAGMYSLGGAFGCLPYDIPEELRGTLEAEPQAEEAYGRHRRQMNVKWASNGRPIDVG